MLRVPVHQLEAGEITLDPDASRYVARVRRVREGESILLFEPRSAREAEAKVSPSAKPACAAEWEAFVRRPLDRADRPRSSKAIGKGDKLDAVVRDATELGATRISPSRPSAASSSSGTGARSAAIDGAALPIEAARQCGRGDVPEVLGPIGWAEALGDATDDEPCNFAFGKKPPIRLDRRFAPYPPKVPLS